MLLRRGLIVEGATGVFVFRWVVGAPPGGLKLRITIPLRPAWAAKLTLH